MRYILLILFLTASICHAFDHSYSDYSELLSKYVVNGRVDYQGMKDDRAGLDSLLDACSKVTFVEYKTFSRARQICFLVNLYNAATLSLVLGNYPMESIQELDGLLTSPWNIKFILLFKHRVGLGHIQHDVLRPEFNEPRLHFALSSAAAGGPHLRNEPYLPDKLETQLAEAERDYMTARPDINYLSDGTLFLSQIFMWYPDDFGGKSGVRKLAQSYFPEVTDETRIYYTDFDWSLNGK